MLEITVPSFEYQLETGVVALRDGFVVTFFLPHPHATARRFVRASIDRYLDLPEITSTLGFIDAEGWPQLTDSAGLQRVIAERLGGEQSRADLHIIDSTADASRFSVRYYGFDLPALADLGWPNAVSGIRFTFPGDYLGPDGLLEMHRFCNEVAGILPFSFGYLSPAFVYLEGIGEPGAFETIRGLAKRFRGLDIPALLPDCFEVGEGPKGAYWGMYLAPTLVEQLGGTPRINEQFATHDVRLTPLERGSLSIYLGPAPIGGDVNRQEDVSVYRAAFGLIRPLVRPRRVPYMNFDEDTMLEWLYRFSSEALLNDDELA